VVTHVGNRAGPVDWAFLVYRLPREPSAPRISLWRSLSRLGATLVVDGLVALPADARTVEHLEWLAAGIHDNGGEASVWRARSTSRRDGERLARQSRAAVEGEYRALMRAADNAEPDKRAIAVLRRQFRAIETRDFFSASGGAGARRAIERLAARQVRQPVGARP